MRDQVTFSVSVRRFGQLVADQEQSLRPKEGDLIFFPPSKGTFAIKFVNTRPTFYEFGQLQTYDLICELFEYAGERFKTGIPEVDALQENYSTDVDANPNLNLDQAPSDFFSDNDIIETEANTDLDFDESNPFGDP